MWFKSTKRSNYQLKTNNFQSSSRAALVWGSANKMKNTAEIKLSDVRKENKECKSSVKGCIKYLYANEGKETKKLLALYGDKATVFGLADKIAEDMGIGKEAHKADGTVRTNKNGEAVIVKVSVDLVARWFIANQAKASEYSKKAEPAKAVEAKATKAA